MTKRAVFLYDVTGIAARPWIDAGYECWLFDGQHPEGITREGNMVKVGMWFHHDRCEEHAEWIKSQVINAEIVIGFPECTDLTVAGARWWKDKREADPDFQNKAKRLALLVEKVGNALECPWCFENPVGALSNLYRLPDFTFNPCDYAGYLDCDSPHPVYPEVYPVQDRYNKSTCIWCGNGFVQPVKMRVEPFYKDNPGWKYCGGKSTRTKNIRSATPRGFAQAVWIFNSPH